MKSKTFSTLTISGCAVLLLLLFLFATNAQRSTESLLPKAQAQASNEGAENDSQRRNKYCSPRTMKGTHGYSYHGTVMGKAITAAGPITFDGRGSLFATYNVNLAGMPFKGRFIGTYTVDDDCTGTVTLQLPMLGISTNGSFVIVNEGKETFFTGTDNGVAITGVTKKQ